MKSAYISLHCQFKYRASLSLFSNYICVPYQQALFPLESKSLKSPNDKSPSTSTVVSQKTKKWRLEPIRYVNQKIGFLLFFIQIIAFRDYAGKIKVRLNFIQIIKFLGRIISLEKSICVASVQTVLYTLMGKHCLAFKDT